MIFQAMGKCPRLYKMLFQAMGKCPSLHPTPFQALDEQPHTKKNAKLDNMNISLKLIALPIDVVVLPYY